MDDKLSQTDFINEWDLGEISILESEEERLLARITMQILKDQIPDVYHGLINDIRKRNNGEIN